MGTISNAILESLLDEITDYGQVDLSTEQKEKLENICDAWEDKDSIESEINIFLKKEGYVYDDEECEWSPKRQNIASMLVDQFDRMSMDTPHNFNEILDFVVEDVNEAAHPTEWHDGDVTTAFRRWIEAQSENQP